MRVAFIGVSHWHIPLYLDPALALAGVEIVGVSDPTLALAEAVAARAGCPAFTDERALLDQTRPQFVVVLGRHCDMAASARSLIERGIPFAIEKPCALTSAEIDDLATRAHAGGVFAAVPFVFRDSRLLDAIRTAAPGEAFHYLAFKFVAGSVERYRATHCDWMLERRLAAGGCMLNLGVHFFDLARLLLPEPPRVVGAALSNAIDGLDTEDHGVVVLRAGAASCTIETGYTFPAPHMTFDLHFSLRSDRHYFIATGTDQLEVFDLDRNRTVVQVPTTNPPYYPGFVREALRRAAAGEAPVAGLADMAAAMRLIEAAYALAPPLERRL
jgi:predicted dehydrogenase